MCIVDNSKNNWIDLLSHVNALELAVIGRVQFNPQTTLWALCGPRNILTGAQEVNIGISELKSVHKYVLCNVTSFNFNIIIGIHLISNEIYFCLWYAVTGKLFYPNLPSINC